MDLSADAATIALALAAGTLLFIIFLTKWNADNSYPPMVGTVLNDILNFKRLHDYYTDEAQRYRTFRLAYPTFNCIYTADPANVEHILKSNFANYGKGPCNYDIMKDLLGDGIFSVDGDKWRQQRKLASLEFSAKVLRDFSSVEFRNSAIKLANVLLEVGRKKQTVEMQDLLMRSTMDAICKVGFGVDLNSLSSSNCGLEASFAKAFDSANAMVFWRYVDSFWKLKRYFNVGSEAILRQNIRIVDDFVYKVIKSRRQEISSQNSYVKPDILSRFIALSEKEPENFSDKYLRDVILNIMIAGRDTTAITLSWFFYLLCKHPHVEEKILQEIRNIIVENECASLPESISAFAQSLTQTILDKMHYLHAALSEALRLYPAVPLDAKYTFSDDTLPDGFKIKKGDMVNYLPYAMGRMTYLWGSDAKEFRPERWLQNGIFQPQSPFKFTAFQGGARICLGKDFAYLQMKIVAAVFIRFFKFKAAEGKEVKYCPSLTLHMNEDGLNLHVNARLNS
eukprot:Gb_31694 [translate_table: standard]